MKRFVQADSTGADLSPRLETIAFLAGLSLFLSTIEYLFPKPVPFFRLGLANLPIILAFGVLGPRDLFLLAGLKVLGQGIVHGTLMSYVFLFSLGGTAASVLSMYAVYRLFPRWSGYIGISLAGALASNAVQIWLSLQFVFGQSAWIIVPYFLGMGSVTGLFVGLFSHFVAARSSWFQAWSSSLPVVRPGLPGGMVPGGVLRGGSREDGKNPAGANTVGTENRKEEPAPGVPDGTPVTIGRSRVRNDEKPPHAPSSWRGRVERSVHFRFLFRLKEAIRSGRRTRRHIIQESGDPRMIFYAGLILFVLFAFQTSLVFRAIQVVILFFLAGLAGKRIRIGYFLVLFISIVLFNLLQPAGRVLFRAAGIPVTVGGLEQGAFRALTLIGFVFASLVMVQPKLVLPGRIGTITARIFDYYEKFNSYRKHIRFRGIVSAVDAVLFAVYAQESKIESVPSENLPPSESDRHTEQMSADGSMRKRTLYMRAFWVLMTAAVSVFVIFLCIDRGCIPVPR